MIEFKMSGCEMLTYEMLEPKVQNRDYPNFRVKLFAVKHNCINYGIIIQSKQTGEKLCYMTDFYNAPMIEGVDYFIYEVNYIDKVIDKMIERNKEFKHTNFKYHNSLENAIEYFKSLKRKPKKIYCCHGSKEHSFKKDVQIQMEQFADEVIVL